MAGYSEVAPSVKCCLNGKNMCLFEDESKFKLTMLNEVSGSDA